MLKLTTAAAILALAALPTTAFAAAPTDATFQLANIAPPEEPEAPPPTPAADPNAPTSTDAPPAPENPVAPTDTPEAVEGSTPSTEPAPEVPDAAAATVETTDAAAETTTEYNQEVATSGNNMGTIIGVIAFLAVAAGAGYWFMNRKA
jgi:cobalamin biosynthesis Mg chelatase CobN